MHDKVSSTSSSGNISSLRPIPTKVITPSASTRYAIFEEDEMKMMIISSMNLGKALVKPPKNTTVVIKAANR